jgi:hypothetical protein
LRKIQLNLKAIIASAVISLLYKFVKQISIYKIETLREELCDHGVQNVVVL